MEVSLPQVIPVFNHISSTTVMHDDSHVNQPWQAADHVLVSPVKPKKKICKGLILDKELYI
jgi:hypothetical protein